MQPQLSITGLMEETNSKQIKLNKCITPKHANFCDGNTEFVWRQRYLISVGGLRWGDCQVVRHDLCENLNRNSSLVYKKKRKTREDSFLDEDLGT